MSGTAVQGRELFKKEGQVNNVKIQGHGNDRKARWKTRSLWMRIMKVKELGMITRSKVLPQKNVAELAWSGQGFVAI